MGELNVGQSSTSSWAQEGYISIRNESSILVELELGTRRSGHVTTLSTSGNSKIEHQHAHVSFVHHQRSLLMGQGKFIDENIQWIVIRLASTMSIEDTAMYSDVSASSIRRILAHFKETGDVIKSKHSKRQVASTLCDLDIQVWLYLTTKLVVDGLLVHAFCTCFNA